MTDNINKKLRMATETKTINQMDGHEWLSVNEALREANLDLRQVDANTKVADGFTTAFEKEAHQQFVKMLYGYMYS